MCTDERTHCAGSAAHHEPRLGRADGVLKIWDAEEAHIGRCLRSINVSAHPIYSLFCTPLTLVCGAGDGTVVTCKLDMPLLESSVHVQPPDGRGVVTQSTLPGAWLKIEASPAHGHLQARRGASNRCVVCGCGCGGVCSRVCGCGGVCSRVCGCVCGVGICPTHEHRWHQQKITVPKPGGRRTSRGQNSGGSRRGLRDLRAAVNRSASAAREEALAQLNFSAYDLQLLHDNFLRNHGVHLRDASQ